jgi:hypothetical protein
MTQVFPNEGESLNDPKLFETIPTGSAPAIILSSLLKETHSALSEHSSVSLVDAVHHALDREFSTQQQPLALIDEACAFFNAPNIGSVLEIAEHLVDEARENRLRDSDPPRTVAQHVRELLANGDEPAALLETIDKWRNPGHHPDESESLRLVVAEEWARKLALEQQQPSTIHASLILNVPDSGVDGHSHTAVANRVYTQIAGAAQPSEPGLTQEHATSAPQPPLPFVQPSAPEVNAPRH